MNEKELLRQQIKDKERTIEVPLSIHEIEEIVAMLEAEDLEYGLSDYTLLNKLQDILKKEL